jgi:hypothetical protein
LRNLGSPRHHQGMDHISDHDLERLPPWNGRRGSRTRVIREGGLGRCSGHTRRLPVSLASRLMTVVAQQRNYAAPPVASSSRSSCSWAMRRCRRPSDTSGLNKI